MFWHFQDEDLSQNDIESLRGKPLSGGMFVFSNPNENLNEDQIILGFIYRKLTMDSYGWLSL